MRMFWFKYLAFVCEMKNEIDKIKESLKLDLEDFKSKNKIVRGGLLDNLDIAVKSSEFASIKLKEIQGKLSDIKMTDDEINELVKDVEGLTINFVMGYYS